MIQHSADFWKFDLQSRFEVRNGFWAQPNANTSWFNIRPIFESLICDRDLRSEMDSEPNLMQKIMIQHSADFWNFDQRSRFEVRNGFWAQPNAKTSWFNIRPIFESLICDPDLRSEMDSEPNVMQNHHDSTFGWFLKVWSAIEIWGQKWILSPTQCKHIMIQHSAEFWKFNVRSRFEVKWILSPI